MPKRRIYRADVKVWATVYIVAPSQKEAKRALQHRIGNDFVAGEGPDVSGKPFDHKDLPKFSFSPMMTIALGQNPKVELEATYY